MRVLIVGEDFKPDPGGVAELTHLYARGFCEKGDDVLVVACGEKGSKSFDEDQKYDVERIIETEKENGLVKHKSKKEKVKKYAEYFSPDIILINYVGIHIGHLPLAAAAAARSARIPFGILAHGMEFLEEGVIPRILRAWTLAGASVIFASSSFTARQVRSDPFTFSDVGVVNPGIDTSEAVNSSVREGFAEESGMDGGFHIGTLSRLIRRKGHSTVIASLSKIVKKYPDVRYFIAGKGEYEEELKSIAKKRGVKENVKFLGRLDEKDKYSFMNLCDIFAMPSKRVGSSVEGFGIVFVEAAACGTPSIATDSGGISDAIDFGKTGIKIDVDSPKQIAENIEKVIKNKNKLSRMAEEAQKRAVEKFDYRNMIEKAKKEIIERV